MGRGYDDFANGEGRFSGSRREEKQDRVVVKESGSRWGKHGGRKARGKWFGVKS